MRSSIPVLPNRSGQIGPRYLFSSLEPQVQFKQTEAGCVQVFPFCQIGLAKSVRGTFFRRPRYVFSSSRSLNDQRVATASRIGR